MIKNIIYIVITIFVFSTFSCQKVDNARQKFAGPKIISHYLWIKADTITHEFNHIIYDMDTLGKVILWDNSSDTYNDAYFYVSVLPAGFGLSGVGVNSQGVGWYTDYEENKSLTFFSEPNPGNVQYCTYVIDKKPHGIIELTAVFYSGNDTFKEVIDLKPISED